MERIIIESKIDIMDMLQSIRRDLRHARTSYFDSGIVTKEGWEASPSARISYPKSKIGILKEAGLMKDSKDFEYGWHFPNAYYAKVSNEIKNADKQLNEILKYLEDYSLRPKAFRFTEAELSRFEVIENTRFNSWLVKGLKDGVIDV